MTSALLVIDVQESFRARPNWAAISNPRIAEPVGRLVAATRAAGDLVIWVLHTEPGTGTVFDPELGHVRLIDGLVPEAGEPVLTKTSHNAFTTTNLARILTERGIRDVVTCGIRTEQCVETTTRVASDLGYRVTFVGDATATHPLPHPDLPADAGLDQILADPRTLPADEVIRRTEYALAGRFATVSTVDRVAGILTGS